MEETKKEFADKSRFNYDGFRLVPRSELEQSYPQLTEKILRMAYEKI